MTISFQIPPFTDAVPPSCKQCGCAHRMTRSSGGDSPATFTCAMCGEVSTLYEARTRTVRAHPKDILIWDGPLGGGAKFRDDCDFRLFTSPELCSYRVVEAFQDDEWFDLRTRIINGEDIVG